MKARLPQGYGGGPRNLQQIAKQAQKLQADMDALGKELDETPYTATAGGGRGESDRAGQDGDPVARNQARSG